MTTPNNAASEAFAANPVLIDPTKIGLVNAALQAFSSKEGQDLLNARFGSNEDFWNPYGDGGHPFRPYVVTNGILQIPVQGVLLNKFSFQFGRWATGYQYIEKALSRGLSDPNVRGIALIVDSPGGEVAGCFELADKIYSARQEKPIRAFAADHAYSAAYALASSASEVVVSRSGGTGSVGVVTTHVDLSGALEQMGIKVTFIFAGKHKVDGNAYEPLPDSVKTRVQDRIDRLYGQFTGMVARNRDVEEKAVRDTEALTFDSQDSIQNKFADRIGSLDEEMVAFEDETATAAEEEQMTDKTTPVSFSQEQMDKAVETAKAAGHEEGVRAERERMTKIMESDEAKNRPAAAKALVEAGMEADAALAALAKMPEEPKAVAPEPTATPTKPQGQTPFDKHMSSTDQPEVGADSPQSDMSEDEKATASIVAAAKTFRGGNTAAA